MDAGGSSEKTEQQQANQAKRSATLCYGAVFQIVFNQLCLIRQTVFGAEGLRHRGRLPQSLAALKFGKKKIKLDLKNEKAVAFFTAWY